MPARERTATELLRALPATPPGIEARGAQVLARAVRMRGERRLARIFEKPGASKDPAGAKAAIKEFEKLGPAARDAELTARYAGGDLAKSLNKLGLTATGARSQAIDSDIADTVIGILRWVEETATRKHTGKTDSEMAALQETFLLAKAKAKKPAPAAGAASRTRRPAGRACPRPRRSPGPSAARTRSRRWPPTARPTTPSSAWPRAASS